MPQGKPDKKKPAAKAPAPVGATSGVSVSETWIRMFEKNEQVEEPDRLTDAQISEHMKTEFPDVDVKVFDRVEIARNKYNRGGFHRKDKGGKIVRPKVHSKSHAADGFAGNARGSGPLGLSKQGPVGKHQKEYKSHKK